MNAHITFTIWLITSILLSGRIFAEINVSASEALSNVSKPNVIFTENKGQWDSRVLYKTESKGGFTWFLERDGATLLFAVPDTIQPPLKDPRNDGLPEELRTREPKRYPMKGHALKFKFVKKDVPLLTSLKQGEESLTPLQLRSVAGRSAVKSSMLNRLTPLQLRSVAGRSAVESSMLNSLTPLQRGGDSGGDNFSPSQTPLYSSVSAQTTKGLDLLPWYNNYFLGNDESKWASECRNFERVAFENVWEGIDVVWYEKDGYMEFDFVVKPNVDPSQIAIQVDGLTDGLELNDGETILKLPTSLGDLSTIMPSVYQQSREGYKNQINAKFALINENILTIKLPNGYNPQETLIIDPLVYSTYLGGTSYDRGHAITSDGSGGCIVTGFNYFSNFPTTTGAYDQTFNGEYDVFISRLNSTGSALIYSTFLGGYQVEHAYGITSDGSGGCIVTGYTYSTDFPTTTNAYDQTYSGYSDVFVTRLNSSGSSLIYSTFLGGSLWDEACGITSDGSGGCIVTGYTGSGEFPTTTNAYDQTYNGEYDVFVTRLNSTGSALIYSTFLGGTSHDEARGIASDGSGGCIVTGHTYSYDFPTTTGAYDQTYNGNVDVLVTRLNSSGSALIYSTFLGGTSYDFVRAITSDGSGGCIVTGFTSSSSFPTTTNAYDQTYNGFLDVFMTRLNSTGSALTYSTYLGGTSNDYGYAITSDGSGGCIVTGNTYSSDFPTTTNAYDQTINGNLNVFMTRLNSSGSALVYSTFIGGSQSEEAFGITSDGSGGCIVTGATYSTDFPTTTNAYDQTFNGGADAFITKVFVPSILVQKPNGGELFQTGMLDTIRWVFDDFSGNVNIELKRNFPIGVWEMIATNVPNTGQYLWAISGAPSNSCVIRITTISNQNNKDISDSLFVIARPTFTVTYPNSADSLQIGNYINFQWNSSNTTGNVRIDLNRNYTSDSWEVLFPSISNIGEQYWQVTGPATTTARFRVIALNNVTACDTSDANFTIYGNYSGLYVYSSISSHNFNTMIAPGMRDSMNVTIRVAGNQPLIGARLVTLSGPFRGTPATLPTVPANYSTLVTLYFEPTIEGTFSGTVALVSNALNADTLRIHLTGQAQWQPQVPRNLQITLQGWNANLTWSRVDSTTNGIPITVSGYLVFYAELAQGPWYFHGYGLGPNATSYTHSGVVRFSPTMFYRVRAWIGSSSSSSDSFISKIEHIPLGTIEESVYLQLRE